MQAHRRHSNEELQVYVHECLPLQALIRAVVESLYRPKFRKLQVFRWARGL